jgi:hypothetical protein
MEWSDQRREGREFVEWSRFPSLYQNEAAPLLAGQFPVSASMSIRRCVRLFRLLRLAATFLFLPRDESPTSECRLWRRIG